MKVIPIHKGGSTEDVNNFRPISLLSVFDKIMEKLVHKRLYEYLELNNLLFEKQFGFRKHNSTVHALERYERRKPMVWCSCVLDVVTFNYVCLIVNYSVRANRKEW